MALLRTPNDMSPVECDASHRVRSRAVAIRFDGHPSKPPVQSHR